MVKEGFMDKRGLKTGCGRLNKEREENVPGCEIVGTKVWRWI